MGQAEYDDDHPLRLSFTLPGSASLGAYQAGAMAAVADMIDILRRSGVSVRIDAIGGSSAGSIVSMLFAHCMLAGKDPKSVLREAWVDEVNVGLLKSNERTAPLGFDELDSELRDFLDEDGGDREPLGHPLILHVGLTSLRGFESTVRSGETEVSTLSYADFVQFELSPGSKLADLTEPAGSSVFDAVLASASHPGGFAPRLFQPHEGSQSNPEADADEPTWYSDGGLVESEPVGRVLEAARATGDDESGKRVHIVVDPRSSGVLGHESWSDADDPKSWMDGLRRSLSILPTQALHDDLRRIADRNDRLTAIDSLAGELADECGTSKEELAVRMREAAGLSDKRIVTLENISPLQVSDRHDDGGAELLAGDFVGAFGGFLNQQVRRADFMLGWESAVEWCDDALHRWGITDGICDEVASGLADAHDDSWSDMEPDGDGAGQLPFRDRLRLAGLAARSGRIIVSEALPDLPGAD